MNQWLARYVRYPEAAEQNNIQGTVVVKCFINKKGEVVETEVIEPIDESLDKEAKRVLKRIPLAPAQKDGEPVNSWLEFPVRFRISD